MAYEEQIAQIVSSILNTMVGWQVTPLSQSEIVPEDPEKISVSGCVTIGGDWEGCVILTMPQNIAHESADTMFALDPGAASKEEVRDCVGELTNMIGGNFKSQLEGKNMLSIPSVVEGKEYTVSSPGLHRVCSQLFEYDGKNFEVSVLQRI
ncbi:MAG: chemotaxis protein CheX [Deltaproteobacteria bacterium]|nr:MAG: chemotaxis protein CheX [Deltaproteobacteria bacterium]